jgi:hypothetical protein
MLLHLFAKHAGNDIEAGCGAGGAGGGDASVDDGGDHGVGVHNAFSDLDAAIALTAWTMTARRVVFLLCAIVVIKSSTSLGNVNVAATSPFAILVLL